MFPSALDRHGTLDDLVNVGLMWHMRSRFSRRRGRSSPRRSARHVCIIAVRSSSSKLALHVLDQVLYLGVVCVLGHVCRVLADVGKRSSHLGILCKPSHNQSHILTLQLVMNRTSPCHSGGKTRQS